MDPELTQNAWINDEFRAWLESRDDGRPWLAMVNYQDPHYPYVCPDPYYSAVDMTDVDLGGPVEGEMAGKPGFYQRFVDGHYWTEADGTQYWDGICIPNINVYDKVKDIPAAIRAYIGMTNMVDVYVGRLLNWLRETGRFEDTLIMFTSDHGDMLGQHGLWGKGIPAYDDNHRVPGLMIWKAAQPRALGEVRSHFNHVDILPTACDAAGVDVPPGVQGISQLPILRGETDSVRDWALVDHVASRNQSHPELDTVDLHQTTFVYEEWKLVVYAHTDDGELYDLSADPGQIHSLWDKEPDRRMRMLHRLARAEMERSGTLPLRIGPS
jgi:arylsulfatase A-like enzyme